MKGVYKVNRKAISIMLCITICFIFPAFAENVEVFDKESIGPIGAERTTTERIGTEQDFLIVPLRLNYQGYLTDDNGNAVSDTATMVFSIYSAANGGSQLWTSGSQVITVEDGVFHYILADVPMSVFETGQTRWLELNVGGQVLTPRTEITSVAWSYYTTLADSASGSVRIGGQDLSALDTRYINDGENAGNDLSGTYPNPTVTRIQTRPVSNAAPAVGQVLKWNGTQWVPATDTAGHAVYADSAGGAVRVGGQSLSALDTRYINSGESAGNDLSGTYPNPTVARIQTRPVSSSAPSTGQVLKWNGSQWIPANDTTGGPDSDWVISGSDMYSGVPGNIGIGTTNPLAKFDVHGTICGGTDDTVHAVYGAVLGGRLNRAGDEATDSCALVCGGIGNRARDMNTFVGGGYFNVADNYGAAICGGSSNHANGYKSFVGGGNQNYAQDSYSTIGGGVANRAIYPGATVAGGNNNWASGFDAIVGGGYSDSTKAHYGGVFCGFHNLAGDSDADTGAVVCGGRDNEAREMYAFIGGGADNVAGGSYATVGGGRYNGAFGGFATVTCGYGNFAYGSYATVGGGLYNNASGGNAAVAGGYADTSAGQYSFTAGNHSVVPSSYHNSAAFNGHTATASGQTRVGALSKTSGTFTIDHPLDPMNKILNHYFVESPEMVLIYRGVAVIGSGGRTEVQLPDYYDALNENSQIQLTGVGTYEVYIAEKVQNNRFVIGGKPGTEVHWMVTGERKDQSAEITKIIMPVEQFKDGDLAGRSLDDDFLCSTKEQLERMGRASGFNFRLSSSQQRYEEMKRMVTENR
jgi:hypothetical protein